MEKEKLYYSIREVAEMFDVKLSTLRYWEKEFVQLKPRKNEKGTRFYTKENIQTIKQIQFLIKEKNLKIEGIKRELKGKKDDVAIQQEVVERLTAVRNDIQSMIDQINSNQEIE